MNPYHLLIAFLLDALLGDPKWLPHPVKGIGIIIAHGERITRRILGNGYMSGILTVVAAVGSGWLAVWLSLRFCAQISPWLEAVLEIAWLYLGLAARGLAQAGKEVLHALREGRLEGARTSLAQIVGRDTDGLDEGGISRAAIESVAENTVDGILSPLFFALLGGAPLLWAFKAVSTCDSMIGYKTEKYLRFGALGARLDDVANYIPARLCLLLFPAAAWLCHASPVFAWRIGWRDRKNHASPNAGIPEAAMAGALKVRLGGPAWYGGELERKPFFGGEFSDPSRTHIARSIAIMWMVSILFLMLGLAIRFLPEVWNG
jgi:adenosylcobinamide-phosphate synthase